MNIPTFRFSSFIVKFLEYNSPKFYYVNNNLNRYQNSVIGVWLNVDDMVK